MRYSNELKVGLSILIATVIFILGVRYFDDLPLFTGTKALVTSFDNAGGLIPGNLVRVNGVNVGSIDEVAIDPATNRVRIDFHVHRDLNVPEGSRARISGFDALGVVQMDLLLGDPSNPPLPDGAMVPGETGNDLLATLTDRAPVLIDRVDSVLYGLDATLTQTRSLMGNPDGNLQQSLGALRGSLTTLTRFFEAEQGRLSNILQNTERLTGHLDAVVAENGDSLGTTLHRLNDVMARLDANLAAFEETTTRLNAILTKIDEGEGSLGLLVNDPGLYHHLDSTLTAVNVLLAEFKRDPRKYLRELKLVDIF